MRHWGQRVDHFFIGDKADGVPFTPEDEEFIVFFASQVAAAIANVRGST